MGVVPSHVKTLGEPPGGQGVGSRASFVASVTGGSICMPFDRAGAEAIPKGKINDANISPLAALANVRGGVAEFFIRIPYSLHEFHVEYSHIVLILD
jgi:hypothetical protein